MRDLNELRNPDKFRLDAYNNTIFDIENLIKQKTDIEQFLYSVGVTAFCLVLMNLYYF